MSRYLFVFIVSFAFIAPLRAQNGNANLLDSDFQLSDSMKQRFLGEPSAFSIYNEVDPTDFKSVTIARTNSLLRFDGFEATFEPNGAITYRGSFTPNLTGWGKAESSPLQFKKLCETIRRLDLSNPERVLKEWSWDRPVTVVRVETADGSTIISCDGGSPDLAEFQALIAFLQNSLREVKGFEGFNAKSGLAPSQPTILSSSNRSFGFDGTWSPIAPTSKLQSSATFQLRIDRRSDYVASLKVESNQRTDQLEFNVRSHEISAEDHRAIVEIEFKDPRGKIIRRLAVAGVQDEQLTIWMIDGRKLNELLFKQGIPALTEHTQSLTSMECDPDKLLQVISANLNHILMLPQRFQRAESTEAN